MGDKASKLHERRGSASEQYIPIYITKNNLRRENETREMKARIDMKA